ncbi:hypothetical protein EZS27_014858 [termite gut metagenome]|uniref:Uncharacterized protein n=1 Tax=termite gut metagenome TaxID=433724 RepID=A0A5J4RV56_9ZZZZ
MRIILFLSGMIKENGINLLILKNIKNENKKHIIPIFHPNNRMCRG